jgi:hypothetical protein
MDQRDKELQREEVRDCRPARALVLPCERTPPRLSSSPSHARSAQELAKKVSRLARALLSAAVP